MPELKIKPEVFYTFLGIPEDADETIFKETFDSTFIKREEAAKDETLVNSIIGKKFSSVERETVKEFQGVGVEFEPEEIKGKKLRDVISLGLKKHVEITEAVRKELEGKIGQGSDAAVTEWKEKFEKADKKNKELSDAYKTKDTEHETFKLNIATERKNEKLDGIFDNEFKGVPKKQGASELELIGFKSHLKQNYKIDLDEANEPFITNSKGERIKNPDKGGAFMTIADVFKKEAIEKNLIQKNQFQDRKVFNFTPDKKIIEGDPNPGRKVHPRAAKAAQQG